MGSDLRRRTRRAARANLNLGALYFESPDPGLQRQGLEMTQRLVEQGGDDGLASSNLGGMYFVLSRRQLELENLAEAKRLI